jgi:hypothetical protein
MTSHCPSNEETSELELEDEILHLKTEKVMGPIFQISQSPNLPVSHLPVSQSPKATEG